MLLLIYFFYCDEIAIYFDDLHGLVLVDELANCVHLAGLSVDDGFAGGGEARDGGSGGTHGDFLFVDGVYLACHLFFEAHLAPSFVAHKQQ